MVIKIPIYYRLEYHGKTQEKDVELLREILKNKVESHLNESLNEISLVDKGFFFKDDDRIEAHHVTISEVHEILRTKK